MLVPPCTLFAAPMLIFAAFANVPGSPPMRLADTGVPSRFVAYLFDELHLAFGDLAYVQKAATKHIATQLQATNRAAVYTTSGRITLEFTERSPLKRWRAPLCKRCNRQ